MAVTPIGRLRPEEENLRMSPWSPQRSYRAPLATDRYGYRTLYQLCDGDTLWKNAPVGKPSDKGVAPYLAFYGKSCG